MMRYIVILLFCFCNADPLWSQVRKSYDKELVKLAVTNKHVGETLNRSVEYLKRCRNYDTAIVFKLIVGRNKAETYLSITCSRSKEVLLTDTWNPYGYFVFQEHLFIVCGDTTSNWFSHVDDKKLFSINREPAIYMVEEPPEWLYQFAGDRFLLRKMINDCVGIKGRPVKFK